MNRETVYIAFSGLHQIAQGSLRQVLAVLKKRFDADDSDMVLVFEVESGKQVDFDLRGSLDEVLERAAPERPRSPGRPKLGVTSREVTMLPRHWEWLEQQPQGISATLRRLVEAAMKAAPEKERARQIRDALSRFLFAIAGNLPDFEEATRALFAGDTARFETLIAPWPSDIRSFALQRAREASLADEPSSQESGSPAE